MFEIYRYFNNVFEKCSYFNNDNFPEIVRFLYWTIDIMCTLNITTLFYDYEDNNWRIYNMIPSN